MSQVVLGFLTGVAIGSQIERAPRISFDQVTEDVAFDRILEVSHSFGKASLQVGKFAFTSLVFLGGELPLRIIASVGRLSTSAFEWGVVKPIELGVALFASGMEVIAHTIALFVLAFVFVPLVFPLLLFAPVFIPVLIPAIIMSTIFRELVNPRY